MREESKGATCYGTGAQLSGERRFIRPMASGDVWQGVKRATNRQYFRAGSSMVGSAGVGDGAFVPLVGPPHFLLSPSAAPFYGGVLHSIPEMVSDDELWNADVDFVSPLVDFQVIDLGAGVEVAEAVSAVAASGSEEPALTATRDDERFAGAATVARADADSVSPVIDFQVIDPGAGVEAAEAISVVAAAGSEVLAPVATGDDDRFTGAAAVAFAAQADLAARAIDWYRHYVSLLRRLSSGHTPVAIVSYCGQGSTTEGVRRAGGSAHGCDLGDQPRYVGRFGEETFSKGDPTSVSELRELRKRTRAFVTLATPPCGAGGAAEDPTITKVRDACVGVGGLYALELEVSVAGRRFGASASRDC